LSVKALMFDWDGTLARSFHGGAHTAKIKSFFFRRFQALYFLAEAIEALIGVQWPLAAGASDLIRFARSRGIITGIVSDRSLFGLLKSARKSGFDIGAVDFVHARDTVLSRFVRLPNGVAFLRTAHLKRKSGALNALMRFLSAKGISPHEALFVGDSEDDAIASLQNGFDFLLVDRLKPDLSIVRVRIE